MEVPIFQALYLIDGILGERELRARSRDTEDNENRVRKRLHLPLRNKLSFTSN
jgi:hypothetical protein